MVERDDALRALEAGIAEANRRETGEFDGLLGQLPEGSSILLRDMLSHLRAHLLDSYGEKEVRRLLAEYEPRPGFRNVSPVSADVDLAIVMLNMIRSALRCEGERFARHVLGPSGARDQKRQAGTRKERRPDITQWIDRELALDPGAKSPDLWSKAPEWLTDQIGERRFAARVTQRRKSRASN